MPMPELPAVPGAYVLVLRLRYDLELSIASLHAPDLEAATYAYAGSACGPGGLASRVKRHLRMEKRLHWHIDYLLPHCAIAEIYFRTGPSLRECIWAHRLASIPGARIPAPGFGSSDCRNGCPAHLVQLPDGYPPLEELLK